MAKSAAKKPPVPAPYNDATERTFRTALRKLEKLMPERHAALTALVDAGTFDDIDAIVAVLEEDA